LEGRVALEIGDLARAEALALGMPPDNRAAILQTRINLAQGNLDGAEKSLASCLPVTVREHLDVAVLAARIAHGRRTPDADVLVVAALELAEVEGFVIAITDDMVELRPHISRILRSEGIGSYQQAVLDRVEGDRPPVQAGDGSAGPLSDRELTVVRYLASRLTYREIASELFVSTNTLKTHVQRIYRKLGVSSRMEAVAEARRLGLR